MTNTDQERERLTRVYAGMSDGQLEKIANEADELTDVARQVLEAQIQRRGIVFEQTPEATPHREVASADAAGPDGLVTIRQFRDLHDALLAQGTLQSADIECFIADDNMVRLDWFISNLLGGVKLRVRQEDAQAALDILEQEIPEGFDVEGVGQYEQPRCPKCQSLDISFEEYAKGASLTVAWVAAPIPIRREKWKCHSCGHEWQESEN
jgi:hypothetical protein